MNLTYAFAKFYPWPETPGHTEFARLPAAKTRAYRRAVSRKSRPAVTVEVTHLRALVPGVRKAEPEPAGLSDEVLTAIANYADRVVAEAPPMDPAARAGITGLLRARAPSCTGSAQDSGVLGDSAPAA